MGVRTLTAGLVRRMVAWSQRRTVVRTVLRRALLDLIGRAAGTVVAIALAVVATQRWGLGAGVAVVALAVAGPVVEAVLRDLVPRWLRARRVREIRRGAAPSAARQVVEPVGPAGQWPADGVTGSQIRRVVAPRDGGLR